jgi:16S rRNA (cytosine1402-N4)-methyltransferase
LEDRIVKRLFKEKDNEKKGEVLSKKPITPSEAELESNPRSSSAKLRILRKI